MVSTHPTTGLTYEDYLKTSDDERWELLNGELLMVPSREHGPPGSSNALGNAAPHLRARE